MAENKNTSSDQVARSAVSQSRFPGDELGNDRTENSGSWFRLTPKTSLVVLVCIAAVFGLLTAEMEELKRVPYIVIVGFFMLMVWRRSAFAMSCLLLVFGSFVFIKRMRIAPELTRQLGWVDRDTNLILASDFLFTFLLMLFVATCFRYLETSKYCLGVLSKFGWGGGASLKKRNVKKEFPSILGGRWWLIPVSIAAAFLLLGAFPLDAGAVQKYWIKPKPARLIILFGILFLVWFLIRSLFSLIMRWKMDEDQAAVHVRSVFAKEFWSEHRAIEARRANAISKKS